MSSMSGDDLESAHLLNEATLKDTTTVENTHVWICLNYVRVILLFVLGVFTVLHGVLIALWNSGTIQIALSHGPKLPPVLSSNYVQVFSEHPAFAVYSPDRGVAAWKNMTYNMDIGAVYIPNSEQYGLFSSELGVDSRGYTKYPIAMFHQLHCLGTIREVFYTLNISTEVAYGGHIGHCFDYLRQSFLCSADLTLEYTGIGMDVEHLCKNPEEVARFMNSWQ